jgi:hypothetical protein
MNHIEQHKEMNKEQAPKETNPTDPGYQDWLTYCQAIATDAKFSGLIKGLLRRASIRGLRRFSRWGERDP